MRADKNSPRPTRFPRGSFNFSRTSGHPTALSDAERHRTELLANAERPYEAARLDAELKVSSIAKKRSGKEFWSVEKRMAHFGGGWPGRWCVADRRTKPTKFRRRHHEHPCIAVDVVRERGTVLGGRQRNGVIDNGAMLEILSTNSRTDERSPATSPRSLQRCQRHPRDASFDAND